ncbi:MAG: hypothetical protein R2747_08870 [Pyrinomonadaceae bacterium]
MSDKKVKTETAICTISFEDNPSFSCDLELGERFDVTRTRWWYRVQNNKTLQMGATRGSWYIAQLEKPNADGYYASCLYLIGDNDSFYPMANRGFIRLDYVGPDFLKIPDFDFKGPGFMSYVNKKLAYRMVKTK